MIIVDQTMGSTHAKTRVDDIVFVPHGPADWLELSEDGVLTGRPEESGTFAFTVIAASAATNTIENVFQMLISATPPVLKTPL